MKVRYKKLKIFGLVFFTLYFLIVITKGCINNKKVMARFAAVQKEYSLALELNKELKQKLEAINSDSFIELTARKRLGLIKPGEKAYKIVEE